MPEILASNIIGEVNEQIGVSEERLCLTKSGRSGISLVLKSCHKNLSEGWILMPDYQCCDVLTVFADEKEAKRIAQERSEIMREAEQRRFRKLTLDQIGKKISSGEVQELDIII